MVDPDDLEIRGSNPEMQDHIVARITTPAMQWSGYFCTQFDQPFALWGSTRNGSVTRTRRAVLVLCLTAYAAFKPDLAQVNVRITVSFIPIDQAQQNLEKEIPDGQFLEDTARKARAECAERLDSLRITLTGAMVEKKYIFHTGFFCTLQVSSLVIHRYTYSSTRCPYEQDEHGKYYSGCDDYPPGCISLAHLCTL